MNSSTLVPFSLGRNGESKSNLVKNRLPSMLGEMHQLLDVFNQKPFYTREYLSNGYSSSTFMPGMDLAETKDKYLVTAELPGMKQKDVKLSYSDGVLVISGEKKSAHNHKETKLHHKELSSGKFIRKVSIPYEVEIDNIEASFENGILTVSLPKTTDISNMGRIIPIKSKGRSFFSF